MGEYQLEDSMREKEYYRQEIKKLEKKNPFMNSTDIAYQLILQEILSEELKPNEKLTQNTLAELFDMSRTPVRDALFRLEKEHFIVPGKKSGYQVHKVSFQEYFQFCDFRMLIESHATYLAANTMSEEEMDHLGEIYEEYCDAVDAKDLKKIFEVDWKFHEQIVKGSHSKYLYDSFMNYKDILQFYFTLRLEKPNNLSRMKKRHKDIYEALRENDEDNARRLMMNHLRLYSKFGG